MKTILIIHAGPDEHRVPQLLEKHGARGYTQIGHGVGAGSTGRLEGTRAWPGHATLWLTITPADQAEILVAALRDMKERLEPGEHLHASVMDTEAFI
jgi:hypothetical protein